MENQSTINGLVRKRSELAGMIDRHQAEL